MLRFFITRISDWLVALIIVSLLVWFGLTQPILLQEKAHVVQLNVSEDELKKHVHQLADVYAPRTISYDNLNNAARYINNNFSAWGETLFHSYWTLNGRFSNVILQVGPSTEEVFVIGAHYDAADNSLDDEGNASGVATLMELARQLAAHENKLSIQVQLVAYPLSRNQSLRQFEMGSFNHAEWLKESGKKVKMMISLDSVGRFNSEEGSQKHPFSFMKYLYSDKGDYISLLGRLQDFSSVRDIKQSFVSASELPLKSFGAPEMVSDVATSDHENYWDNGFPALLLTDTAEYRYTDKDNLDVSKRLDYKKMAFLVQGLYQVVMDSQSEEPQIQLVQQKQVVVDDLKGELTN